jgi:hypothetical protein
MVSVYSDLFATSYKYLDVEFKIFDKPSAMYCLVDTELNLGGATFRLNSFFVNPEDGLLNCLKQFVAEALRDYQLRPDLAQLLFSYWWVVVHMYDLIRRGVYVCNQPNSKKGK